MALFTVSVSGTTVEVYGGLTAAKDRLKVSSDPAAKAFTALTTDEEKSKRLIDATRMADRMMWPGKKTTPAVGGTVLKWPRTDVIIDEDGEATEVDDQTVPEDIVNGVFELAAQLALNPALASQVDQSNNIASLGAGSAQISYFAPTSVADGTATALPWTVEQYFAKYLRGPGGGSSKGGAWFGASEDGDSAFDECSIITRNDPF